MEDDRISEEMTRLSMEGEPINENVFGRDEVLGTVQSYELCLVGRFVTQRAINFATMEQTLASLWHPTLGMTIKKIEDDNLYVFEFFHVVDLNRVLDMSPWTFNGQIMFLEKVSNFNHPSLVPLFHLYLWLQVHNLRDSFWSEKVAKHMGNEVGEYLNVNPTSFKSQEKPYLRVRVKFDIHRPICKGMYLRRDDEEGFFANFEYERLPNFYFICDTLRQGECFCRKHLESNGQSLEQRYGLELNADPRRKLRSIGARWLKDEPSPAEEIAAGVSSAQSNSNSNGTNGADQLWWIKEIRIQH